MITTIQITGTCNIDCDFCLDEYKNSKEIPIKKWEKILDNVKGKIYITGGEICMYSGFERIFEYLKSKNRKAIFNTNGYSYKQIVKNHEVVDEVIVSLDTASAEDNEKWTRGAEQFKVAIEAMRKLKGLGLKVRLASIVSSANPSFKDLIKYVKNFKIDKWELRQYLDTNNIPKKVISDEKFERVTNKIIKENKDIDITQIKSGNTLFEYVHIDPSGKKWHWKNGTKTKIKSLKDLKNVYNKTK